MISTGTRDALAFTLASLSPHARLTLAFTLSHPRSLSLHARFASPPLSHLPSSLTLALCPVLFAGRRLGKVPEDWRCKGRGSMDGECVAPCISLSVFISLYSLYLPVSPRLNPVVQHLFVSPATACHLHTSPDVDPVTTTHGRSPRATRHAATASEVARGLASPSTRPSSHQRERQVASSHRRRSARRRRRGEASGSE